MATSTPIALSALHYVHVTLGAVMVDSHGWQRPARYTSADDELERLQRAVGMCDVSPSGKLLVQGESIDALLGASFPKMEPLQTGRVLRQELRGPPAAQEIVLARLADDEVLALCAPGQAPSVSEALGQAPAECGHAVDITSALAGFKIAGPLAHRLMAAVTELDTSPEAFEDMSCAQASIAEVHGTVLRLDAGAVQSYELYVDRGYGEYMWDALMESGEEHGVVPFGTEALARLESGE